MLMILRFHTGKAMVASSVGASKGFAGKDIRLTNPPLLGEPSPDAMDTLARGTGVLDIALASGRGGAISRDALCSLLSECLQDVSSFNFVMFCLFALLPGF
jgi:hypothetical protein